VVRSLGGDLATFNHQRVKIIIDPIFKARCNCLYNKNNISTDVLDQLTGKFQDFYIPVSSDTITSTVEQMGNWVGGNVYVFSDKIVFSMNEINAAFQKDVLDLIVPINIIDNVEFGKIFFILKTVDCDLMGTKLRFRCNGKNNHTLLSTIKSFVNRN
jgi:hypothetical protein